MVYSILNPIAPHIHVFAPCLQPMYKRYKLKNAGLAIGAEAGVESCHGLFSHCLPVFAKFNTIANIRKQTPHDLGNAVVADTSLSLGNAPLAIALSASAPASGMLGDAPGCHSGQPASSSTVPRQSETPETDEIKAPRKMTRDDFAKSLRKVLNFLEEHCDGWGFDMLIFKSIVDCHEAFMGEQIKRSTVQYAEKQRIRMAKSMMGGNPTRLHARDYHAVEAAMCDLENRLFDELARLRDSDSHWVNLIPPEFRTRKRLAVALAMITRQECSVEAKHVDEHKRHPTRQYLALVSDDLADEVSQGFYQPSVRFAKGQPRVEPSRAIQDPTRADPWPAKGAPVFGLD